MTHVWCICSDVPYEAAAAAGRSWKGVRGEGAGFRVNFHAPVWTRFLLNLISNVDILAGAVFFLEQFMVGWVPRGGAQWARCPSPFKCALVQWWHFAQPLTPAQFFQLQLHKWYFWYVSSLMVKGLLFVYNGALCIFSELFQFPSPSRCCHACRLLADRHPASPRKSSAKAEKNHIFCANKKKKVGRKGFRFLLPHFLLPFLSICTSPEAVFPPLSRWLFSFCSVTCQRLSRAIVTCSDQAALVKPHPP